jgi:hypothetical protein
MHRAAYSAGETTILTGQFGAKKGLRLPRYDRPSAAKSDVRGAVVEGGKMNMT